MFGTLLRFLKVFGLIAAFLGSFALSYIILAAGFGVPEPIAGVFVFCLYLMLFWIMAAYIRYRIGRQEELLQVLRSAVDSQVSLETAVKTYLDDRPSHASGPLVLMSVALLLTPIFPGSLLLMLWYHWFRYDRKVERFRSFLYDGLPVCDALHLVPGVLSDEARLDIRVGIETNRLALALRRTDRERLAGAWLELVPRVVYPLFVMVMLLGVQTVSVTMIVPKYKRNFDEFHMTLPALTKRFVAFSTWLADYGYIVGFLKLAFVISVVLMIVNPTARWRFPFIGRFYRRDMQGRVLRNLSLLVEAEVPAREALELLADSTELPHVARTRLGAAADASAAGLPLSQALAKQGLLPRSMMPLLDAAEQTRTLPWALRELGEHLSVTALRSVRRLTLILSPIVLVLLGLMVAFTSIGMFLPLVELISGLAE